MSRGQEITSAARFLIFGHRGAPKRFPENTLPSFEEALRAGADGFETDLRFLADNTAVLFHDDELDGAVVESLTSAQCIERGATIERLADLSRFAGRAKMVLEVKRSRWEDALIEHVSAWPDIVIASFDHSLLLDLRRRGVTFETGMTIYGYPVDAGVYGAKLGVSWCYPNIHYVDEAMVSALHQHSIRVVPWTANRVEEWERLREMGCDGVITDVPHEAVAWKKANEEFRMKNEE